jgi:hypothetical protein
MRSEYGDYIYRCESYYGLDFSQQFVDDTIAEYGEEHYESRRNKITAWHGFYDDVSTLGEVVVAGKTVKSSRPGATPNKWLEEESD